jgi:hypothetical protein
MLLLFSTYPGGGVVIDPPSASTTGYAGFQLAGTVFGFFLLLLVQQALARGV